jgi:hypothetical protein
LTTATSRSSPAIKVRSAVSAKSTDSMAPGAAVWMSWARSTVTDTASARDMTPAQHAAA